MKIGGNRPDLPLSPKAVANAVSTAAPALPTSPPTPRVLQGASTFTGGVERRFSVQFMRGIESRLSMTGLSKGAVQDLTRRFGAMGRSELDVQGRVVDTILAGSHPKEGMAVYHFLSKLGSAVTPGGFRVAPNHEHSWTITPPQGEPFVLPDKKGAKLALADGALVQIRKQKDHSVVEVMFGLNELAGAAQKADRAIASAAQQVREKAGERAGELKGTPSPPDAKVIMDVGLTVAELSATVVVASAVICASIVTGGAALVGVGAIVAAAATVLANSPELLEALGKVADELGAPPEVSRALKEGAARDRELLELPPIKGTLGVTLTICAAAAGVMTLPGKAGKAVKETMARCGQSAAPSSRCDPGAEQAALYVAIAHLGRDLHTPAKQPAALAEFGELAQALRGQPREVATGFVARAFEGATTAAGSLRSLIDGLRR